VQALLQHADADGDGSINYREFLAAAMDMQNVSREMALRAAFVEFDTDGSGTLSPEEVIQVGFAAMYADVRPNPVLLAMLHYVCKADAWRCPQAHQSSWLGLLVMLTVLQCHQVGSMPRKCAMCADL
jgi:hypothetical protein